MKYSYLSIALLILLAACGTTKHQYRPQKVPKAETLPTLTQAYRYGFPLVLMDLTREMQTNTEYPTAAMGRAPLNQFVHMSHLPDSTFKDVVRPNVGTLYSSAWVDLSDGPLIIEVPTTGDRYYMMPMLSAWTNVYASPGKRTTGTLAKKFMVVGPKWDGDLLPNTDFIRSPTNLSWINVRIELTQNEGMNKKIAELQKGFKIYPASFLGKKYTPPQGVLNPNLSPETPLEKILAMSAEDFFNRLNALMMRNPPAPEDDKTLLQFEQVSIAPGEKFSLSKFKPDEQKLISQIPQSVHQEFQKLKKEGASLSNGWSQVKGLGEYGVDYQKRALVAYMGFGASLEKDVLYPTASIDISGQKLKGDKNYILHFDADEIPSVKAFWSLTAYDAQSRLVENKFKRYSVGSLRKLKFNRDGSLDIYLQHNKPSKEFESNWLPTPKGEFDVTARLFWPNEETLDPNWSMPPIVPQRNFKDKISMNDKE